MKRFLVVAMAFILLFVLAAPAPAHEHRHVEGYEIVFGWRIEPAMVGQYTGPEFRVYALTEDGERGDPVEGLEQTLKLEVSFGPSSRALEVRPQFGDPGHYIADLMPTRPGDYSFHLTGTINDVEVDEIFTSADGEFSSVRPVTDIMFPDDELPSLSDLRAQIDELLAMLEALTAE